MIPIIDCKQTGTVLWTLEARDDDGDLMVIRFPEEETESKYLVVIRQTVSQNGLAAAEIILNQTLDRDYVCAQLHFHKTSD